MSSSEAVPFESPPSLSVDIALPNRGTISGMGIRKGVTLVVGGGFHGKTTLLKAVEAGVYNKVWTLLPQLCRLHAWACLSTGVVFRTCQVMRF